MRSKFLLFIFLFPFAFSWASDSEERERFQSTDFSRYRSDTKFTQCVRLLIAARFQGQTESLIWEAENPTKFAAVTWYRLSLRNGQAILIRLTGYGWLNTGAAAETDRYFMHNGELINFGVMAKGKTTEELMAAADRARGKGWRYYVECQEEALQVMLRALSVEAKTSVISLDSGEAALAVGFGFRSEQRKLAQILENFRGIAVRTAFEVDDLSTTDLRTAAERAQGMQRFAEALQQAGMSLVEGEDEAEPEAGSDESALKRDGVNFSKLGGHLPGSIRYLLSGQAQPESLAVTADGVMRMRTGWNSRFSILVTVQSDDVARRLKLRERMGGPRTYRAIWSLRQIALATQDPGIMFIKLSST